VIGFIEYLPPADDLPDKVIPQAKALLNLFRRSHQKVHRKWKVHRLTDGDRLLRGTSPGLHDDQKVHVAIPGRFSTGTGAEENDPLRMEFAHNFVNQNPDLPERGPGQRCPRTLYLAFLRVHSLLTLNSRHLHRHKP
jgi:hypothetical protein